MGFLGRKKKQDLLEVAKEDYLDEYMATDDPDERARILENFMNVDKQSLEHEKVRATTGIGGKDILKAALAVGLAGGTFWFERTDVIHSKVAPSWLKKIGDFLSF